MIKSTPRTMMLALGAALTLITPMTAASAHDRHDRGYHRGYDDDRYESHRGSVWRGEDGRYYCRRSNGTTGLIVGAAGGALAGRAIDTRGERATGAILGAAVGALLGRELQRGRSRCR